jgi:hypothetical protein
MNKRNSSAGTNDEQRTAADSISSAILEQNGMLAEVLLLLEKEYKEAISHQKHGSPSIKYFQGREDVCKEVGDFIRSNFR